MQACIHTEMFASRAVRATLANANAGFAASMQSTIYVWARVIVLAKITSSDWYCARPLMLIGVSVAVANSSRFPTVERVAAPTVFSTASATSYERTRQVLVT